MGLTVTFDGLLAIISIVLVIGVGGIAWRRPEFLQRESQARIERLEKEYEAKIEGLRRYYESKLERFEKALADAEKEIETLRLEYRRMASDYLRIIGENHWLRLQLRAQNIDIPPLPDDLRPQTDAQGNISITVSRGDVNTVDVGGPSAQVSAGRGTRQEGL